MIAEWEKEWAKWKCVGFGIVGIVDFSKRKRFVLIDYCVIVKVSYIVLERLNARTSILHPQKHGHQSRVHNLELESRRRIGKPTK